MVTSKKNPTLLLAAAALLCLPTACGEEEQTTKERGAPKVAGGGGGGAPQAAGSRRTGTAQAPRPNPQDAPEVKERPDRPKRVLTREDFGPDTRDPFMNFLEVKSVDIEPDAPRESQRNVRMAEYSFEDLTLIGIVNSSRGLEPRALFRATDNRSKTIRQGEYFSRAEVLLATVNRDYVEIEVVDEELAKGLNLERGERRAIYLKNE